MSIWGGSELPRCRGKTISAQILPKFDVGRHHIMEHQFSWHQIIRLDCLVDIRSSDWIVLLTSDHQTGLSCWHQVIRLDRLGDIRLDRLVDTRLLDWIRRRRGGRRRWGSLTWRLERKGSIAVTRHVIYSLFFKLLRAKKVLSMTM